MNVAVLRVGLAVLWLVVGAGLLTRRWWAAADLDARAGGRDLTLLGAAAVALAAWNVLRLWGQRCGRAAGAGLRERVEVHRRRRDRAAGGEYHPEFDFGERDGPSEPRP